MILQFSISKKQLKKQSQEIEAAVRGAIPEAGVELDTKRGVLRVHLPPEADPIAAADTLNMAFTGIGVQARRVPADPFIGGMRQEMPPVQMIPSQPQTVRLSVFIISLISVALAVAVVAFSFSAMIFGGPLGFGSEQTLGTGEQEGEDYAGKIALVDKIFEEYSLYDTNGQLLLDEMLKAYAAATGDKYAAYYTPEEFALLMTEMESGAVGVGVTVTWDADTGEIVIIQVAPGSPAAAAGVLPGDRIVKIGSIAQGELVSTMSYEVAMTKMAGAEGTVAQFVVSRNGTEIEFSITRAAFTVVSAEGFVSTTNPKVGVVRISGFEAKTPKQFKDAMNALISAGCERFVFDVRNNPGGEQKSITAVLSYFLNENDTVLSTVAKDGTTTYYKVEAVNYDNEYADCSILRNEIGMYRNYQSVVLTNGNTASAAELFTAGLADYGLTTVVGTTTFGKGIIQSVIDLSSLCYGYKGGLKLTTGYYMPPSGVNYDGVGIIPSVVVELDGAYANTSLYLLSEQQDNQLQAAISAVLAK